MLGKGDLNGLPYFFYPDLAPWIFFIQCPIDVLLFDLSVVLICHQIRSAAGVPNLDVYRYVTRKHLI